MKLWERIRVGRTETTILRLAIYEGATASEALAALPPRQGEGCENLES
jgi:hypothetical protein